MLDLGLQGKPFQLEREQLANGARDDPIVAVALASLPAHLAKQVFTLASTPQLPATTESCLPYVLPFIDFVAVTGTQTCLLTLSCNCAVLFVTFSHVHGDAPQ